MPYEDRKDINPKRVEGTCEWFTSHPLFQGWQTKQGQPLLWVSADPGCGKSVLARYLVDDVLQSTCKAPRTICYFFFKDGFEDQRSLANSICCILHQVFTQRPELLTEDFLTEFETKDSAIHTSFKSLWSIFARLAVDGNEVICILDALDECGEKECRLLTSALCDLYYKPEIGSTPEIKFLLTSRPYIRIQRDLQSLESRSPTIHLSGENQIEVDKIAQEINFVIRDKVKGLRERLQLSPNETKALQDELTRTPNRTYLWVYLIFDLIEDGIFLTDNDLPRSIRRLPKTVEAAYDRILCKSRNKQLAKRLLHIVVAAQRPLTLDETVLALAIQESHRTFADLKLKPKEHFRGFLRELCGLFIIIVDSKVYLLHQTAKEFLIKGHAPTRLENPDHHVDSFLWKSSLKPAASHLILTEICVWHLLFKEAEDLLKCSNDESEHIFEYSAKYWVTHWRLAQMRDDAPIQKSVLRLFHQTSRRGVTWYDVWSRGRKACPSEFSALTLVSYFGMEAVVKLLINQGDEEYMHEIKKGVPLKWAVIGGPLDTRITFGCPYHESWGPDLLGLAAYYRHNSIVRLFLERHADTESRDSHGRTPLFHIAYCGNDTITKVLLQNGAHVNARDNYGRTPLFRLARGQRGNMIRLLLDNGANINIRDNYGETLLSYIAGEGIGDMVQLLLKNGADINVKDGDGATPLSHAARAGDEDIARLLLQSGADINARDDDGTTLLSYAVRTGNEVMVRLLLDNGADIHVRDNDGTTALFHAARARNEAITRLLLDHCADVGAGNDGG